MLYYTNLFKKGYNKRIRKAIKINFSQNLFFFQNKEITHELVTNHFFFSKVIFWVVKKHK